MEAEREVLHEGPGFAIAIGKRKGHIPMSGHTRHDGSVVHDWVDLRDKPERAPEIPEAVNSPGLQAMLATANGVGSPMMTSGCARWPSHDAEWGHRVIGYVDLMFRDPQRNRDQQRFVDLAGSLLGGVGMPPEGCFVNFDFEVHPLFSFFGDSDCFCLNINVMGRGETSEAAQNSFDFAWRALASSLGALAAG